MTDVPGSRPDPDLPLMTDRLILRAHRSDDAALLRSIYSKPDVARYLLDDPWSAEEAIEQVRKRSLRTGLRSEERALALVIQENGAAVGDVALWHPSPDDRTAEVGWVLDPTASGRGIASEAVRAVLNVAFAHYGLHRVAAQMDARNEASARLAERVGMVREAHLRQDWWSKGEWTDTVTYGMLASDGHTGH